MQYAVLGTSAVYLQLGTSPFLFFTIAVNMYPVSLGRISFSRVIDTLVLSSHCKQGESLNSPIVFPPVGVLQTPVEIWGALAAQIVGNAGGLARQSVSVTAKMIEVVIVRRASAAEVVNAIMVLIRKRRIVGVRSRDPPTETDDAEVGVARIADGVGTGNGTINAKRRSQDLIIEE